ncbi:MAG: altronate dehydratase family protein [Verrucomicrobiaceae bacterium]|nr:altronate dehydratase family protein [Verrucomicrobiaceae bacterium]
MTSHLIQRIDRRDDAIVALQDLPAGGVVTVDGASWTLIERIPAKQKFAARDFASGDRVTMYGVTVGRTKMAIRAGALLSTANLAHETDAFGGKQGDYIWAAPDVSRWAGRTFDGFRRPDGPAGTANYWIVIPLVFCENRNLAFMREALTRALGYAKTSPYEAFAARLVQLQRRGASADEMEAAMPDAESTPATLRPYANVDGVKFLEHGLGCGGTRQDAEALCGLLAGCINSPNVAGATVLSLGCQHAQVSMLESELAKRNAHFGKPLYIFEQQKSASEREMMQRAIKATLLGVAKADEQTREPVPLSDLIVGVECGGSDGFSGISANPVIGHAADLLVALGGAPVLSEFPELCGIEQSLCDRCVTGAMADKFVRLMRAYEGAAKACGSGFDANPSPGNIRDGLITDAIKSAGAAKKGGTAPVVDVLDYPEAITRRGGLSLYCTPGNDVESTTALAAGGCNMILFSTGLGTPTGNPFCPTLKISTNTSLATRMADIIDYDTGPVITGGKTVVEQGAELLDLTIATASGRYVPKAVALGQDDFLPWKRGVSL